jgi:curli production assembly/transport component CsgF
MQRKIRENFINFNHSLTALAAMATALPLCMSEPAFAGQLVYTPVNPNFGGSPLNGSLLEYQATNNNKFQNNPTTTPTPALTAQQQVAQNLQQAAINAVLSEVAQQITSGLQNNPSGSFNVAGELINFQRDGNVVNVQLTDATTGAVTTIQIPVPTF